VPLPSFSEPVQTALALLAIVPPWGSGFRMLKISEIVVHFPVRCKGKPGRCQRVDGIGD
jgi:hypothetical protein